MKIDRIIFWVVIGILIIFATYGITLSIISNSMCNKECNKMDALTYKIHYSGNLRLDDVCMCIFEDKIKAFRLKWKKT